MRSDKNNVRNIVIKDSTGQMDVALWNDCSTSPVKSGSFIRITHTKCAHNNFVKKLALGTIKDSSIEVRYY